MNAIEIKSLIYAYDPNHELQFPDWTIQDKEDALILGPSGSGKTTFLHLLCGLLTPNSGELVVNGYKIHEMSGPEIDYFRKTQIGIVFQQPHLIKSLSVEENLQLACYLGGQKADIEWIHEIMDDLGLMAIKDKNATKISQGQAQRVAIARAVINRPGMLFGDEPTASLDDENCHKVINLLKKQARLCEASLIIATHDQRVKKAFPNQLVLKGSLT